MTANDVRAMTDNEIAIHIGGGYGPHKREEIMAVIRQLLEKEAVRVFR